jgi:4-hydroxyphenylacetate 3-monooxygenase
MNYAGSHELIRLFALQQAQASGSLKDMDALVERCLADYDETGWKVSGYYSADDVSIIGKNG